MVEREQERPNAKLNEVAERYENQMQTLRRKLQEEFVLERERVEKERSSYISKRKMELDKLLQSEKEKAVLIQRRHDEEMEETKRRHGGVIANMERREVKIVLYI